MGLCPTHMKRNGFGWAGDPHPESPSHLRSGGAYPLEGRWADGQIAQPSSSTIEGKNWPYIADLFLFLFIFRSPIFGNGLDTFIMFVCSVYYFSLLTKKTAFMKILKVLSLLEGILDTLWLDTPYSCHKNSISTQAIAITENKNKQHQIGVHILCNQALAFQKVGNYLAPSESVYHREQHTINKHYKHAKKVLRCVAGLMYHPYWQEGTQSNVPSSNGQGASK